MLEKWFGVNNKKENNPSVEGVEHFNTNTDNFNIDPEMDDRQESITLQEEIAKIKLKETKNNYGKNEKRGNGLKPIRKDKNKDWKEQEPFALDLPEDEETPGEKHLNALAEIYDDEDDFEEEHREAA